jgi:predicted alpha/beta hydrolase family esterase
MAAQMLFVQGAGAGVHDQWDNKLVESLEWELGADFSIRYPQMPNEDDPSYAVWKPALIDECARLPDGAILVGHSIGGAFLLHTLVEERSRLRPAALFQIAAPFLGEGGWHSDEIEMRPVRQPRMGLPVFLYHGTDDQVVPFTHARLYAKAVPMPSSVPFRAAIIN